MSCPNYKTLCPRLIISDSVTFDGTSLVVNIPQRAYENNEKYCIIVAQSIPTTTTIGAPVVITIGEEETQYPLLKNNCTPVTACAINTRTRYSVIVHTNIQSGVFSLIGKIPCSQCAVAAPSLPITTTQSTTTTDSDNG